MALDPGRPQDQDESTPDQHPTSPPPGLQADQHSSVLQTIMELQKTVGKLTGTVENLTRTVEKQSTKIDTLRDDLTKVLTSMRTAYVILGVVGSLIAFALYRLPTIVERLPAIMEALRAGGPGSSP